jgi:hypothetical protein
VRGAAGQSAVPAVPPSSDAAPDAAFGSAAAARKPSSNGGGSSADDDTCCVCLDRPNGLHVAGCMHLLCVPCYRAVVLADNASGGAGGAGGGGGGSGAAGGATCPFCRGPIDGFVYSDPAQRAVLAQLAEAAGGGYYH